MLITLDLVEKAAPDQASLKAASKLMKSSKWPLLAVSEETKHIWAECQGSGANPYRVIVDCSDRKTKCTCPSRKFPCKHALALMWLYAETPEAFEKAAPPDWVAEWMGRRKKTANTEDDGASTQADGKSIAMAKVAEPAKPVDEATLARREAAAQKRAAETRAAILGAMDDLELWIEDQLRTGLSALLADVSARCRAIAARMVDGKAGSLGGRIDQIPAAVMALPGEERLDGLIVQLSKLVILARAYRATPDAPDIRRAITSAESRETVLDSADALRVQSRWEVAGERITTRRDDLISQETWLMNLRDTGPRFALLFDTFPIAMGKRSNAFASGEQFEAELVFYPGRAPLRAIIGDRTVCADEVAWPDTDPTPLADAARHETALPWSEVAPVLLPAGRIAMSSTQKPWWVAETGGLMLPVDLMPPVALTGMVMQKTAALWDGTRLAILSSQTPWGRLALNE